MHPKQPEWMDDNILMCEKHSITFTREQDECFVCTNRVERPKMGTTMLSAKEFYEQNSARFPDVPFHRITGHNEVTPAIFNFAEQYTIYILSVLNSELVSIKMGKAAVQPQLLNWVNKAADRIIEDLPEMTRHHMELCMAIEETYLKEISSQGILDNSAQTGEAKSCPKPKTSDAVEILHKRYATTPERLASLDEERAALSQTGEAKPVQPWRERFEVELTMNLMNRVLGVHAVDLDAIRHQIRITLANYDAASERRSSYRHGAAICGNARDYQEEGIMPTSQEVERARELFGIDVHTHQAVRHAEHGLLRQCGSCGEDVASPIHIQADESALDARQRIAKIYHAAASAEEAEKYRRLVEAANDVIPLLEDYAAINQADYVVRLREELRSALNAECTEGENK